MKSVYIDLRYAFAVSKKSGRFNGGNNYAKIITQKILLNKEIDTHIISDNNEIIQKTFNIEPSRITIFESIKGLNNFVYFNPLISDSNYFCEELKKLKKYNRNIKIILTIHDRRHHENIFDKYNGILENGIKRNWILYGLGRLINSYRKDLAIKNIIQQADEIFTVSNYSMQQLLAISNPLSIKYFTCSSLLNSVDYSIIKNYILFVSAGRSEKNFIRTIKAFETYVNTNNDKKIKLKVTGLSDKQKKILKEKNIINETILNNQVDLLDYIDEHEMSKLYAECKFLLFTSKSEGFGLPVAEAMLFNKPVVASRVSSIPEVMGSAAIYVDPYSINSIVEGIKEMMDSKTYNKYLQYCKFKRAIWKKQVELDNKVLIERIIE